MTERYARNMIFQEADLQKVYYSKVTKRENDNIDAISEKQASLALSSAHLLKSLLLKFFWGSPKDLQEIQKHDLKLNKIMDKVKAGSSKEFVLINKILYKKCQTPDVFLLCIPQKIASAAAWNLHNLYGFHFSKDHMTNKLRKIIFCPDLDILVQDILNTCPVCTLAPKKALYRQIGSQKSTLYRPL